MNKSSLSAGAIIRNILMSNQDVKKRTNKIYPIVVDKALLPYIVYRRSSLSQNPTNNGGADSVTIEIVCYTANYSDGIELAEAVRAALDYQQGEADGLKMRSCTLADSAEGYEDDAFVQQLVFNVRI